jgi:uncharacterized membrane protein
MVPALSRSLRGESSESLPPLTRIVRTLGLGGIEAVSAGLTVWLLSSRASLQLREANLEIGTPRRALIAVGVALLVGMLVAIVVLLWKGRVGLDVLERLARRMCPVSLVWLVPFLLNRSLWGDHDLVVLPLVLAGGWGLVASLHVAGHAEPAFPELAGLRAALTERWRPRLARTSAVLARIVTPLGVVTVGAILYAIYFSAFTIRNHNHIDTHGYDLGIWDNLMWHVLRPEIPLFRSTPAVGPHGSHFGRHATFFAYVIAPFYAVAPRPETLLVVQAVLLGGAAIPLFLYAKRHLPAWTAALVAGAYLIYPPLHGANLYDFHFLALGPFFLLLALYAIEDNRRALAVVAIVLSLSVREDVAALLAIVGLFFLLTGASPRVGAIIAALGGCYFLLMKMVLMPLLGRTDASFLNQYSGLLPQNEEGFSGVLKTLVGNPIFTAKVILQQDKVTYFLEIFAPVLLLPLRRPIGLLLICPGVIFTLLSTGYWPLYQPSFQYTAYWTPFVFIGVVYALEHAGRPTYPGEMAGRFRRQCLVVGLAATSLVCTYLDGAILNRTNVRSGFIRATFATSADNEKDRADVVALIAQIPPDAKVAASDRLVPHVSTRDYAYSLSDQIYDADWILLETTNLSDIERNNAVQAITDSTFGVVDERGRFLLARRGTVSPETLDALLRIQH